MQSTDISQMEATHAADNIETVGTSSLKTETGSPNVEHMKGLEKMNHERYIYVYAHLIGSVIDITMDDLTVYRGVLYAIEAVENNIAIRHCTIIASPIDCDQYGLDTTLILPFMHIIMITAKSIRFMKNGNQNSMDGSRIIPEYLGRSIPMNMRMKQGPVDMQRSVNGKLIPPPGMSRIPVPGERKNTYKSAVTSYGKDQMGDLSEMRRSKFTGGDALNVIQNDTEKPIFDGILDLRLDTNAKAGVTEKVEEKRRPIVGPLAPFPVIDRNFIFSGKMPRGQMKQPMPMLSKEEQIAEFRKFGQEFNSRFRSYASAVTSPIETLIPRAPEDDSKEKTVNSAPKGVKVNSPPIHKTVQDGPSCASNRRDPAVPFRTPHMETQHLIPVDPAELHQDAHRNEKMGRGDSRGDHNQTYRKEVANRRDKRDVRPPYESRSPMNGEENIDHRNYGPMMGDRNGGYNGMSPSDRNIHNNDRDGYRYDNQRRNPRKKIEQRNPQMSMPSPYQQQVPQVYTPSTPVAPLQGPNGMMMSGMQMMGQGDMQMTLVPMLGPDGMMVMQPMMMNGNQFYPMNYNMMYPMNGGYNYQGQMPGIQMMPPGMMYDANGIPFMMQQMQQMPGIPGMQMMNGMPMMQPMMMNGMSMQQVPGVPGVPGIANVTPNVIQNGDVDSSSAAPTGMNGIPGTPASVSHGSVGPVLNQANAVTPPQVPPNSAQHGAMRADSRRVPHPNSALEEYSKTSEDAIDSASVIDMIKQGDSDKKETAYMGASELQREYKYSHGNGGANEPMTSPLMVPARDGPNDIPYGMPRPQRQYRSKDRNGQGNRSIPDNSPLLRSVPSEEMYEGNEQQGKQRTEEGGNNRSRGGRYQGGNGQNQGRYNRSYKGDGYNNETRRDNRRGNIQRDNAPRGEMYDE